MIDCTRFKKECVHEWRVFYVYLPDMRIKCVHCAQKRTVTFTALSFVRCWVLPYVTNPAAFARYKKTIAFFELNKKMILKSAMEETQQLIDEAKKKQKKMEGLKRFCQATAAALL